MEIIKSLIARLRNTGVLFLIGILLISYIALGFLYWQQGGQQSDFMEKITKLSAVLGKPLPSGEELQAGYDVVNQKLVPMTDTDAIAMLVGIAEESGINIDPDAGKFHIPEVKIKSTKVGGGNYQLLSFSNIRVQSDYDSVMAFISDLDSGKTLGTMVLTRVATNKVEVTVGGEEGARRAEFRNVISAVTKMMDENDLSQIPFPLRYADSVATNLVGDDPDTVGEVEGFPDVDTTVVEKDYTGTGSPRGGYVLYEHDKISADDATQFVTVNYISTLITSYYYTCEIDGTVRQFDGPDAFAATEYLISEASDIEISASVDVDIYTKPQ